MLLQKIEESKNIIISSHINPDGDAIGSGLGLYLALTKKYPDKSIRFILEDMSLTGIFALRHYVVLTSPSFLNILTNVFS